MEWTFSAEWASIFSALGTWIFTSCFKYAKSPFAAVNSYSTVLAKSRPDSYYIVPVGKVDLANVHGNVN